MSEVDSAIAFTACPQEYDLSGKQKRTRTLVSIKGLSFSVCAEVTCFGVLDCRSTDGRCSLSREREKF